MPSPNAEFSSSPAKDITRSRGDADEEGGDTSASIKPHQQIAVAVVERDGKFLAGLRASGQVLAGLSEFPGGKIHTGEMPADAAARECLEETGIAIIVGDIYQVVEHDYPHGRLTLHFFRCTVAGSTSNTPPTPPFRWVARDELATLRFPEANRSLLEKLLHLKQPQP